MQGPLAQASSARAATTLLWITLNDPIGYAWDSGTIFECQTEYGIRRFRDEPDWRFCYRQHPATKLTVSCASCGVRTFTICGEELRLIGLAPLYCTEAEPEHKIIKVLRTRVADDKHR